MTKPERPEECDQRRNQKDASNDKPRPANFAIVRLRHIAANRIRFWAGRLVHGGVVSNSQGPAQPEISELKCNYNVVGTTECSFTCAFQPYIRHVSNNLEVVEARKVSFSDSRESGFVVSLRL